MEGFSKIVAPLVELTKNDLKFEWNDKYKCIFQELKERLNIAPMLPTPKSYEKFTILSDMSYQGLGNILMQNGKVIAFSSK